MSSYTSSPRNYNDDDYFNDDLDSTDYEDDRDLDGNLSDEDTEDASETEDKQETNFQRTEIKEQMYQDKLAQLKKQLQLLAEGKLPEYTKRIKKVEQQYAERLALSEIWRDLQLKMVEREFIKEKEYVQKEFEDKKIDLKENLISELEEKKRSVEGEKAILDLNGDFIDMKPVMTRKLRRRPNEPIPLPEKRRKPTPAQLNIILSDDDIMHDIQYLNKISGKPIKKSMLSSSPMDNINDVRIEDGKLYYDKRWFQRNHPVFVESKDAPKTHGIITGIGTQEIWIRKTSDNSKLRIYLTQLQKGKYVLRRRAT
ncbi:hypothetical protein SNE40_002711 [Patella caerulea]|uniref:Sin3 histone deacetylase corepressor complex component SDS3 n=1 Tax=Patella caerulea TaxID=87958 RepID=A0AAN8PZJ4_PATCE